MKKNSLLAGKNAVQPFSSDRNQKLRKIQDVFGKEGIQVLNSKPEHLDRIDIQNIEDMNIRHDTNFSTATTLGERIAYKTSNLDGDKQAWRDLVKKAHNDFNAMFPPEKFTFAFFGSFLNFAKGDIDSGYDTLPGDIDVDADIGQFGQYLNQLRKEIKNNGDIINPKITGTGAGYPVLNFYNKRGILINIFTEELSLEELTDILKTTLEKPENQKFYGALRLSWDTTSAKTQDKINNEIYFNQAGKGLTQISTNPEALTQVDRDTVYIELDGKRRRYLNARAQSRMYTMNLIYENQSKTAKGIKAAGRIQKIGELNPSLAAYKLLPMLLKVRLSFIMQAPNNKSLQSGEFMDFEKYLDRSLDPYVSGAVTTNKLQKSIGFDQKTEALFKQKNREEIKKDKQDLLLDDKEISFMVISVKRPKVADLIQQAWEKRSISLLESAHTLLSQALHNPGDDLDLLIDMLNRINQKKDDLKNLQNIELVERIKPMKTHPHSIGDKLVKFYAMRERNIDKAIESAENSLETSGFNTKQRSKLIKFLENHMIHLDKSYSKLEDEIKKIEKSLEKNKEVEIEIEIERKRERKREYLKKLASSIELECTTIGDELDNLILFGLKEDTISSFALFSAGIDVRDRYIDAVRRNILRIKKYIKTGRLPSKMEASHYTKAAHTDRDNKDAKPNGA